MKRSSNEANELAGYIYSFLNDYAPNQRTSSIHTLRSYDTALSLYIGYLENVRGVTPSSLSISCFEQPVIEEWLNTAIEGFQGNRTDKVGQIAETEGLQQYISAVAAHELRAVEQGQTFFRLQGDGLPTELVENLLCWNDFAFIMHFSQAEQRQHEVGQRCQVAGSAERALVVDHGQHIIVEEVDEALDGHHLHAAVAIAEALHL